MSPNWIVTNVEPMSDYRLLVTFRDKQRKIYSLKNLLDYPVFAPLRNEALFNSVRVEACTAVWNDQIDIDPEVLYNEGIPC